MLPEVAFSCEITFNTIVRAGVFKRLGRRMADVEMTLERPLFEHVDVSSVNSNNIQECPNQYRRILIPHNRLTPLKQCWIKLYTPLVEHMKLQVKMNLNTKHVELRSCAETKDEGAIQKGADFVRAFSLGFDIDDCVALLRLDDLFLDSFEIKDVKTLHGDHLSRAIGRIAGKNGKTKFTIENVSKTRIVLADSKIHILGSFQNIRVAKDAIVSLILGSPPGKVYAHLRTVASRLKERS